MRGLRDTKKLKALLRQGKSIELRDRNRVIGRIVPEADPQEVKEWPDFEANLKEIFGDRVLTAVDDLLRTGIASECLRGFEFSGVPLSADSHTPDALRLIAHRPTYGLLRCTRRSLHTPWRNRSFVGRFRLK